MSKLNVQIFGQPELIEHLEENKKHYSHLISIGNPNSSGTPEAFPEMFKQHFKKILRLEFYDVLTADVLRPEQEKRIPERRDIEAVIKFFNETKNEATGYTIHCWRGISRSTAIALGVLYLIHQSEEKAAWILRKIRSIALPHVGMVEHFDAILGTSLVKQANKVRNVWVVRMKEELEELVNNSLEELESIDDVYLR